MSKTQVGQKNCVKSTMRIKLKTSPTCMLDKFLVFYVTCSCFTEHCARHLFISNEEYGKARKNCEKFGNGIAGTRKCAVVQGLFNWFAANSCIWRPKACIAYTAKHLLRKAVFTLEQRLFCSQNI